MDTPFVFGKLAIGNNFTDREKEINRLKQNFLSGINTILISPRRWGKSSLVKRAGDELAQENPHIKVVYLDMFNIRTEEEFYKTLSEKVLKEVSGKMEEMIAHTKKFFKQWLPQITFSPDAQQEFSLKFDWAEIKKQPDEILNLPEAVAKDKGYKIIVCIDEFQNTAFFEQPLAFQKKIRSFWQTHQNTAYCLYGSKRHMLMEVFSSPSMPFYKFGDLLFLDKIPERYWQVFIREKFLATGKSLTKKQAGHIASLMENHPYYVQQLAQLCWFRTRKKLSDRMISEAVESLVLQLSLLFQNVTEALTTSQVNFLLALIDGVEKLTSKKTIETYHLNSSAQVIQIKKALINKEIIDERVSGKPEILDPVYKIWLRKQYRERH